MTTTYDCEKYADKIAGEIGWICAGANDLEIILALSILIGRYGNHGNASKIGKEIVEQIRKEEFERAKDDFDNRLKKVMEIK